MPIVASRGEEIRVWLEQLSDPKKRVRAEVRLRALGARVVPHAAELLSKLSSEARRALLDVIKDVMTADATALRARITRAEREPAKASDARAAPGEPAPGSDDIESRALETLRALPPPRATERPSVSRERGEAHLALARIGSKLARQDLLASLRILTGTRLRPYWEASALIGDASFIESLARVAAEQKDALDALATLAERERITPRSKTLAALDEKTRLVVARALIRR